MRVGETEQQMAVRHVAEQEKRIAQQEALIERLRKVGAPSDGALGLLALIARPLKNDVHSCRATFKLWPCRDNSGRSNADSGHSLGPPSNRSVRPHSGPSCPRQRLVGSPRKQSFAWLATGSRQFVPIVAALLLKEVYTERELTAVVEPPTAKVCC